MNGGIAIGWRKWRSSSAADEIDGLTDYGLANGLSKEIRQFVNSKMTYETSNPPS